MRSIPVGMVFVFFPSSMFSYTYLQKPKKYIWKGHPDIISIGAAATTTTVADVCLRYTQRTKQNKRRDKKKKDTETMRIHICFCIRSTNEVNCTICICVQSTQLYNLGHFLLLFYFFCLHLRQSVDKVLPLTPQGIRQRPIKTITMNVWNIYSLTREWLGTFSTCRRAIYWHILFLSLPVFVVFFRVFLVSLVCFAGENILLGKGKRFFSRLLHFSSAV